MCTETQEYKDLKSIAGSACIDIYNSFAEKDLKALPESVVRAWRTGERLSQLVDVGGISERPSPDKMAFYRDQCNLF